MTVERDQYRVAMLEREKGARVDHRSDREEVHRVELKERAEVCNARVPFHCRTEHKRQKFSAYVKHVAAADFDRVTVPVGLTFSSSLSRSWKKRERVRAKCGEERNTCEHAGRAGDF